MGRKVLVFVCIFAISLGVAFFATKLARRVIVGIPKQADPEIRTVETIPLPSLPFANITELSGLNFKLASQANPQRSLPESIAGGVCALDFDNDGLCDLYFPNLGWPCPDVVPPITGKLYRNLGGGKMEDVTEAYGLAIPFLGMGVCAGDYDNDGFIDLFVSCVGGHRLFRNEGGKKFREVTQTAFPKQIDLPILTKKEFWNWAGEVPIGTSCTFVDYDLDGRLDIFICQYVIWSPKSDRMQDLRPRDFSPKQFGATHCKLFRNVDGKAFVDVSEQAGVQVISHLSGHPVPVAAALGVIVCDANDDGYPDLIVTNDGAANFFFRNAPGQDGKRLFVEEAERVNLATPEDRVPLNHRGLDFGEIRPNQFATIMTAAFNQKAILLRVERIREFYPQFVEIGQSAGISELTRYSPKYSALFADWDLDGRQDLMITTSSAPQLFWNSGKNPLYLILGEQQFGLDLAQVSFGRGCALFDLDGDGDLDFVVVIQGREAKLFQNNQKQNHHWLRLHLLGDGLQTNTTAIGAKVTIEAAGESLTRYVSGSRGYLSQSELTITVGLAKREKIDRVIVRWPNSNLSLEEFTDLKIDQTHTLRQGTGRKL